MYHVRDVPVSVPIQVSVYVLVDMYLFIYLFMYLPCTYFYTCILVCIYVPVHVDLPQLLPGLVGPEDDDPKALHDVELQDRGYREHLLRGTVLPEKKRKFDVVPNSHNPQE